MGYDDRDDNYRSRSQAPRRRSYDANGDEDYTPRSASRPPRDPRDMSDPRSRPPRRDYDDESGRPSRAPRSIPGGPSGSSGRYPRDDYDRRSAPPGAGEGSRRNYDNGGANSNGNRPSRAGWSDPGLAARSGPPRGGRPPAREDAWGSDPRSARGGPNSYGGRAAPSDGRMRRVAPGGPGGARGGGLWGDESGAFNAQAVRARMAAQQDDDEEEEGSAAAGVAKAIGAIILALLIGAGAAYGYYVMSTPKLNATPYQQATPVTTPSGTPSVTPSASATKTGLIAPANDGRTLFVG